MAVLNIAIIGAGIGGPVAAIGLAKNGHRVTLYDRSKSAQEIGYAFRLTPNSDRVLKYLGIDAEAGGAVAANVVRKFDMHGNPQDEAFRENQGQQQARQAKSVFAFRHQLSEQLMDLVISSGVLVKFGVGVKRVDIHSTSFELDDGTTVTTDVIIAADGVKSVVRPAIVDSQIFYPKASSGHNAFRFMLNKEDVIKHKSTSAIFDQDSRMFTWMGNNKMILAYPVDFNRQLNVVCTHPQELSDQHVRESESADTAVYNNKASRENALNIYREFEPNARRLLELADAEGLRVWKLTDMDEIPTWSKHHTVLIGDACHPVLPYSFSGASMAIEDAITLAVLLPGDVTRADISSRLQLYEKLRRPRVERVRNTGREIARGMQDGGFIAGYMRFLASHDAVGTAQEFLRDDVSPGT